MNIYESAEDYLEAILILRERQGAVRSIDVVRQLELTKPSVSVAMKRFRENGYIEMDADGFITLLPPGEEIAQRIYNRHKLLTKFLVALGVSEETAAADACKMEHDLSDETFEKIKAHAQRHEGQAMAYSQHT
ncbi:metal-dependent transcriptional regulator [Colidextribacter sp. OB.20]|uniref:metal-dependent transcriptional regulator n=1 Tax=Colidextribacter sp. OB.20 TaxID=2304568 RepID=UPI001369FD97|nr:metal-dependent transcriptional regulator [Colidextribacter sp. OB.20]NBI09301.1 metal-dependent transcriptional regulator [Colidextribacter sp. OB.20]